MNPIAVIFDMDGVIVDTNPFHFETYRSFWNQYQIFPTDAELALHLYGKTNRYILEHFFERPITQEELLDYEEQKEGLFRKVYEPHVKPIAGLMDFLMDLKKNNVKTGVATSAPRPNLDLILSKIPLAAIMESMLSSEDVLNHKPNPEVYLKSMKNLGVSPSQTIIFEDSSAGILAAKASGAKVVGVLTTHQAHELPPCDAYITDYQEIGFKKIQELLEL